MEQIGVMAVVEGLAGFSSDMGKVNSLLDGLKPHATALMQAFDGVGEAFASFGESIIHVAEIAIGVILRDAIEWLLGAMRDVIASAIEAGNQFQTLTLRLQGMNLQDAFNANNFAAGATDAEKYTQAMQYATEATKQQLTWIMKLAAFTPFDAVDIANIYTMARSYGFADEAAQGLVESITDFTAGMGLSGEAMDRIIVNFGQMVQRGKITTRELNDLARGSMVPIGDILDRIAKKLGITVAELSAQISKPGGGVDPQLFIDAFEEMTNSEERFRGASERMARTFQGASQNILQTTRDLLGMYVVQPVLDALGQKLSSFMDAFSDPARWDRITTAMSRIGKVLADIATGILGLAPDSETLADNIISGIEKIATWLEANKSKIIGFFDDLKNILSGNKKVGGEEPVFGQGLLDGISKVRDFIVEKLIPAFDTIKNWIGENKPLIDTFFATVGEIVGQVLQNLFGIKAPEGGGGLEGFLGGVKNFLQWVIDNKEQIAQWVTVFAQFVGVYLLVSTISAVAFTALIDFLGFIISTPVDLLIAWTAFLSALTFVILPNLIAAIQSIDWSATFATWVGTTQAGLAGVENSFQQWFDRLMAKLKEWFEKIGNLLPDLFNGLVGKITSSLENAFHLVDLTSQGAGAGRGFIDGLIAGIEGGRIDLMGTIITLAQDMIGAILDALDAHSPSRVMANIGENIIGGGLAEGITNSVGAIVGAVSSAMQTMAGVASAMPSQTSTSYSYNNAYNLTINSNANAEQVTADFGMMQSMAGA